MLTLSLLGIGDLDETEFASRLRAENWALRLVVIIPDLYSGGSYAEIAHARLAMWYIAELLADHGSDVRVSDIENDDGSADVEYLARITPGAEYLLAAKLSWLAPTFDADFEDGGTSLFDFGCEITGWVEERSNAQARFPDLKAAYEDDAEAAREQEMRDESDN